MWFANLQLKKACVTRRMEMMEEMQKKGDLPISLLTQLSKEGSGNLPAKGGGQLPKAPQRTFSSKFR